MIPKKSNANDISTNSPNEFYEKCMETSNENLSVDIMAEMVNDMF